MVGCGSGENHITNGGGGGGGPLPLHYIIA